MPPEPNHPMEEPLREAARRRRDEPGAPAELHPANRRMLQAEVRKVYGSGTVRAGSVGWWFRWPGLAAIGAVVVAAGLTVLLLPRVNNPREVGDLARAETPPAPAPVPAMAPAAEAPIPAAGAMELGRATLAESVAEGNRRNQPEQKLKAEDRFQTPRAAAPAATGAVLPAATPMTAPSSLAGVRGGSAAAAGAGPKADAMAPAMVPASPAPPVAQLSLLNELQPGPPPISLFFRNASVAEDQSKAAASRSAPARLSKARDAAATESELAAEFQVRIQNGQVSIVDQDGSLYNGQLLMAAPTASAESRKDADPARNLASSARGFSSAQAQQGIQYSFRATGTNKSTRQPVRVDGELRQNLQNRQAPFPNSTANTANQADASAANSGAARNSAAPGWEFRSKVQAGAQNRSVNGYEVAPTPGQQSPQTQPRPSQQR